MHDLSSAIENLYTTFAQYTIDGMHYCNCGCVKEEYIQKLNSKPLRELEVDDVIVYHGKALYTWGDVEHYKHYLPRICALISAGHDTGYLDLEDLQAKLTYAEWTAWPIIEQEAIKNYIAADWISRVSNMKITDREIECYSQFIEIDYLLNFWEIEKNDDRLINFIHFFYDYGSTILHSRSRFITKGNRHQVSDWALRPALVERLEAFFFERERTNLALAAKTSVVLQMIEQAIAIRGK